MKIYAISDENVAKQLAQLIKLNAECAKLHWSRTIKDIPVDVSEALETIEAFVEDRVNEQCRGSMFGELSADDETAMMTAVRKTPELREALGTGVVCSGEEAEEVKRVIQNLKMPGVLIDALETGKNIIIF